MWLSLELTTGVADPQGDETGLLGTYPSNGVWGTRLRRWDRFLGFVSFQKAVAILIAS
jgi:hypothetical protein